MTCLPALASTVELATLPATVREEVTLLDRLVKSALASANKMLAYEAAARELRAAGHKYSASGFRALCAQYRANGSDWRTFIDWRKMPHDENSLPAAFLQEVKRRCDLQGRSSREVYLDLLNDWRRGKPIPGYAVPPEADPYTGRPRGWSNSNLARKAKSTKFEKAAMRIGLGYAKAKHGPKLHTSRQGLWPLSHVMFDDVDHDTFIHLLERNQVCRVSNLGAYDVLSGDYFTHATKPLFKRFDAKLGRNVTDKWKEAAMRYLVAQQLTEFGYNPRGTEYVLELGTSTLRDRVIGLLHDRSKAIHGEAVLTVSLAGWTGKAQVVEGMFNGQGGGNPRHKAHLESLHNLLHNKLAALPGQTGPDVARRPEQLDGLLNASDELMRISQALTPWQREQFRYPTLEYHSQFLPVLRAVIDAMNRRTEHELQGWAECGFLTTDYRFHRDHQEWITRDQFLALPDSTQALLTEVVRADRACQKPRRMSPHEVFQAGRNQLVRADQGPALGLVAELMYEDFTEEPRGFRQGVFEISDREIDPEPMLFEARITTLDGRVEALADDKYEVKVNPFQPSMLWVYSGKRGQGSFLGIAPRVIRPSYADRSAKGTALAALRTQFDELKAPLVTRHRSLARAEQKRLQHNIDVITGPAFEVENQLDKDRSDRALNDDTATPPDLSIL